MVKPEFCGKRLKNELVQEKISKSFPCAIFLALFMILVCVFFFSGNTTCSLLLGKGSCMGF